MYILSLEYDINEVIIEYLREIEELEESLKR